MTQPGQPATPALTACSLCAGESLGPGDVPRQAQLARLRQLVDDGVARLTLVECLDECERGDVVAVRPAPAARASGASPVWFEHLAGDERTAALAEWLRSGGPGRCAVPAALRDLRIRHDGGVPGDDAEAGGAALGGADLGGGVLGGDARSS